MNTPELLVLKDFIPEGFVVPENRWLTGLLSVGMLAGVCICLWRITRAAPTQNETLLLSLVLTLLSVIGSWIASRYYSESSFNKNLRVFALKAAEKVTNLSSEFDRLAVFLQQELKETEYENPQEALLAKNIRIEGAIHVINTLKSVNDKSLSDWQGVIGEEISAKREEQEEREETIRELLERLDSFQRDELRVPDRDQQRQEDQADRRLRAEVSSIKEDLRLLAGQVTGVPIKRVRKRQERIEKQCPSCGGLIAYKQRTSPGGLKGVNCKKCGSRFVSKEVNGEFSLQARRPVPEQIQCSKCGNKFVAPMDPVPGSSTNVECSSCHMLLGATRTLDGIKVRIPLDPPQAGVGQESLSANVLDQVVDAMGPQPWPKGQAKLVAEKLGLAPSIVGGAVQELIRRGVFKHQIDGRLFVPETDGANRSNSNRKA